MRHDCSRSEYTGKIGGEAPLEHDWCLSWARGKLLYQQQAEFTEGIFSAS